MKCRDYSTYFIHGKESLLDAIAKIACLQKEEDCRLCRDDNIECEKGSHGSVKNKQAVRIERDTFLPSDVVGLGCLAQFVESKLGSKIVCVTQGNHSS
jgi:hypothetical protein